MRTQTCVKVVKVRQYDRQQRRQFRYNTESMKTMTIMIDWSQGNDIKVHQGDNGEAILQWANQKGHSRQLDRNDVPLITRSG